MENKKKIEKCEQLAKWQSVVLVIYLFQCLELLLLKLLAQDMKQFLSCKMHGISQQIITYACRLVKRNKIITIKMCVCVCTFI